MKKLFTNYRNKNFWQCPVCLSRSYTNVEKHKSRFDIFVGTKLITCKECLVKSVYPMPSEEDLKKMNINYWDYQSNNASHREYLFTQAKHRFNYLQTHIRDFNNFDILEIGAGHAFIYDILRDKNYKVNYSVVETDIYMQKELKAKGIDNLYSTWRIIKNSKFNLIIMLHVIEHFASPLKYLEEIKMLLKNDGYIFFEVPNQDDRFKEDLGAHLVVFSVFSVKKLFEKLNMSILDVVTVGQDINDLKKSRKNKKRWLKKLIKNVLIRFTKDEQKNYDNKNISTNFGIHKFDINTDNGRWIRGIIKN